MSILIRFLSGMFTAFPATVFGVLIYFSAGRDYYWIMYYLVEVAFLIISFLLGFFVPAFFSSHWLRHPRLWLFGQGISAWLAAVLALGLISLTPLCIGQDNGDGNNNLGLCIAQTILVSMDYSPLEFILLFLSVPPGRWLIKRISENKGTIGKFV